MQSQDSDLVAQLKRDWRRAKLSEANRAMLEYAEKLTVNPSGMTKTDLDGLRQHFSEEQTFDIVIIACLFNFMDRLADAFGVELDPILSRLARSSPDGEALAEVAASTRT
jgi:alkylhydroperoxidase family enzyme